MEKFYVSFGVQYANVPHPVFWKVPDLPARLWELEAEDEEQARQVASVVTGRYYSSIYTRDQLDSSLTEQYYPGGTFTYDIGTGKIGLDEHMPERPRVILEWWSTDGSQPPCIDFTCVCGYWKHLCNGAEWVPVDGNDVESAPGVGCRECGKKWSLGEITPVNEL